MFMIDPSIHIMDQVQHEKTECLVERMLGLHRPHRPSVTSPQFTGFGRGQEGDRTPGDEERLKMVPGMPGIIKIEIKECWGFQR